MRVKVLSLALLAAVVALPVPASQLLAGTFSAPSPAVRIVPGDQNLRGLLSDPVQFGELSFERPASFLDLDA